MILIKSGRIPGMNCKRWTFLESKCYLKIQMNSLGTPASDVRTSPSTLSIKILPWYCWDGILSINSWNPEFKRHLQRHRSPSENSSSKCTTPVVRVMENLRKLYAVMICKASCNIKSTNFLSNSVDSNLSSTPYWLSSQGRVILTFRSHFFIKTWNVLLQIFLSITGDPGQVWPPQHRETPFTCALQTSCFSRLCSEDAKVGHAQPQAHRPACIPGGKRGCPGRLASPPTRLAPRPWTAATLPSCGLEPWNLGVWYESPQEGFSRWLSGPPFSHLQGEPRHYRRSHLLLPAVGQTRVGKSDQERTRTSA